MAFPNERVVYVPDDWYVEGDEDRLFELLKCIGKVVADQRLTEYDKLKFSIFWAVEQAAYYGIRISHSMIEQTQKELDNYSFFEVCKVDFELIATYYSLQELIKTYEFPFYVRKLSWSKGFYFRAEYVDSEGWVRGTSFCGSREYRKKEYRLGRYQEVILYGSKNVKKGTQPQKQPG